MKTIDTAASHFAVWIPGKGYAADWQGEVIYCATLDDACLFDKAYAHAFALRNGGGVVDTDTRQLLTVAEREA